MNLQLAFTEPVLKLIDHNAIKYTYTLYMYNVGKHLATIVGR